MTPEQRRAAFALVLLPGGRRRLSPEEFADELGQPPREWALDQLLDAIARQDGEDAEAALVVSGSFGRDRRWARPYVELLESDWHLLHEQAAQALGELGGTDAVPALVGAAHRVPAYLAHDEGRALAVKAVHSLGRIPGPEAEAALRDLLEHEDHELRVRVRRVLDRRLADPPGPR